MSAKSSARTEPRELVITRLLDAPRELVWKVWSEPEHMVRWSGPRGFTFEILEIGRAAGDRYRFHMVGPDGDHHWQQGMYREIKPPERLVSTFVWTDAAGNPSGPETLLSVTFEDLGKQTRLVLRQTGFASVTARDEHRNGWSSGLDCLAEYLDSIRSRN